MTGKKSEISILILLLLIGVAGILGVTMPGAADHNSPSGETTPVAKSPSSPLVSVYDSEECTVIEIADDAFETGLDPATLEEESRTLLENFTGRSGKNVAPRYLGLAGVTPPEDAKIVAYIFRVLPTGETVQYIGLCGKACRNYSGVLARADEWKEAVLIPRTNGALTMEPNPQPIATVTMDCEYPGREYGEDYGYAGITSTLSWDCEENDRYDDYFFVRTTAAVDAGLHRFQGSSFHNHVFAISHDWMCDDSSGYERLPLTDLTDYGPDLIAGPAEAEISLMPWTCTPLSCWTCTIPAGEVWDDSHPADELAKWDLAFDYDAGDSQTDFTFDPGSTATCLQSPARDGQTYSVCRVEMNISRGWSYDGFFFFDSTGPENAGPLGYTFFTRWEDDSEVETQGE